MSLTPAAVLLQQGGMFGGIPPRSPKGTPEMFQISPPQVPVCLSYFLEYAHLREFQNCACRSCLTPLEIRIRLKLCELKLPSNLVSYFNLLVKYPYLCPGKPLAAVSNGRCENCGESMTAEQLSEIGQTAFITCENCRAILIPSLER